MYVDCDVCPLRRNSLFRPLIGAELDFVRTIKTDQIDLPAGEEIVAAGNSDDRLYTIFSGWAYRYLNITDRHRQILDILLPGDLIALQSPITGRVRHCVRTITPASLCLLDGPGFRGVFATHPQMAEALVATLLFEENRADRRLATLGRLRPTFRLTYALLELRDRMVRRALLDEAGGFALPLTYELLGDFIGVSRAQLGASLKELRQRGWAHFAPGYVQLLEVEEMTAAAHYDLLPHPEMRALV
jgi:CRP-like cAMP-binding protein